MVSFRTVSYVSASYQEMGKYNTLPRTDGVIEPYYKVIVALEESRVSDHGRPLALSCGQKQRLLIARALYRRPNILFLDEATSHLDLANEAHINASVAALKITRIFIAHRPSTIASADRVIEL